MNNRRLSTNTSVINITRDQLMVKVNELLKRPSNLEELGDGRFLIKSLNKIYVPGKGLSKIEIRDEDGNLVNSFDTITECAKFLDVSNDIVSRTLLKKGKPIIKNSKILTVKRVTPELK